MDVRVGNGVGRVSHGVVRVSHGVRGCHSVGRVGHDSGRMVGGVGQRSLHGDLERKKRTSI